MAGEVIGDFFQGLLPPGDAVFEGGVDVLEGLFGGGVAEAAEAFEDAAGGDGLFGFVGEEGEFEGDVVIGGIAAHGIGELIAGGFGVADFEEGVGEVFARSGFGGVGGEALLEEENGLVVILLTEGGVSAVENGLGLKRNGHEDVDF